MSSTVPFPAAAARPEYLDRAVSDDEESIRGGEEEGVARREEQREEDDGEDEEEVKEAKDNAGEEGDPDLLLFHNQGNVGDRNGEEAPEAPAASSSSSPRPPSKPSRGGTPIGSSKTSSKKTSSARSSGGGGEFERRPTRSHQQRQHQQQQQSEESRVGAGTGSGVGGVSRGGLEWVTIQHLDLTPVRAGLPNVQPHAAAFHHTQALFAAAVGKNIIEYDALTGCKLSSIDIGAPVVRMSYSPAGGHIIVAVLEDWTIRSWDLDTEHTYVLYSPGEKKSSKVPGGTVEVHIALTPLRPWLFFGAHHRMSVNVVGTIEGVRAATRIKTDLRKPITDLACHPRSPLLYVAYADGLVRAYNIQNFSVQYTLQVDPSIKLIGAGSFAFHSLLEWVFVGDRSGALLAWDVSAPNRPTMIGIAQVGNNPIAAMSWHSMLQLLLTLSKEGSVQVWRPRVILNPRKDHLRANFFEPAGLETMDVGNILTQFGGVPVYPIPRIVNLFVHPKLNLATVLFATMAAGDEESKKKTLTVSRESRKQLFAVLQSARGSPVSVLKEKLSALGSAGILQGHQLLQQARAQAGGAQVTMSDLARKAFLYGNSNLEQVRSGPILTMPLMTITDYNHLLRDVPVCQPLHQELMFFNSEQRIFNYPVRVFFMDGCNLTSYNLTNGDYNVYKKLSSTATGGNERTPKHMIHSSKHHLFLIFFECRGAPSEVVLYRDPQGLHAHGERTITVAGCDGAFIGRHESQFVILEDDGMGLTLDFLEDPPDLLTVAGEGADGSGTSVAKKGPVVPDAISFEDGGAEPEAGTDTTAKPQKPKKAEPRPPVQFVFDSPVQRVFSCPLESTILYVLADSHLGLAKVSPDAYTTVGGHLLLSTKPEAGKFLKLNSSERVLQVRWQETLSGQAAGIMTTQRVLITSANLEVLSSTSTTWDKGFPPFRSLVWAGPSLLFSTSTAVVILGWDGVARPLATIGTPNAALVGALNDRLLLACANDPNPRNRQMVEIKTRLLGLLEPLLIGWTTLQKSFEPKLDLTEIMYQLTSRFDNLRVTPRSLDTLSKGPPICGDLAVELAQSGPQFTQELRCTYAIRARRFDTALGILKDEYLRSRDYPKCPPSTRLFQRFRELGRACIRFGQFDYAKETFEVVSDYESMLDLFICHLNPSALRRLLQKLDEAKADPELRRHVDKILSVRSVGWGQGGAYANLTAESMAPKPLEWGGGNWQIQTTSAAKGVPHWELSGEVTAYMKTMNGAIPTMIPDHIGVYLGTLKGRGTVVEVQETRHGRRFGSGVSEENGTGEIPALLGLGKSGSNKSKASDEDANKAGGGLAAAAAGSGSDIDAQARAEEEFKKGMYEPNASSSDDDEEATKNKRRIRINIREKQGSGSTVDVNKVKEATKRFQLGDSMRGVRSQRLGGLGSQDPTLGSGSGGLSIPGGLDSQGAPPPFPMTAPPPSGTAAPSMMMGVGVGSGPIPEDIFQGESTIPSFQAYPPPQQQQLYPGQWSMSAGPGVHPPPPQEGFVSYPSGVPVQFQGGPPPPPAPLPPGAAPGPQVAQQPGGPPLPPLASSQPAPVQGSTIADISLPDGGVPPKAPPAAEPAGSADPSRAARLGAGAQPPTDLSALAEPGRPPQPTSPKGPPKLGQVPRGAPASKCFKVGLAHVEQNQLTDAMSCFNEAFLALAKDQSLGVDVKPQARICAQYKIAVLLLQEIARLQRVEGQGAVGAKEEMARLSRHLSSLPLQAKHRISCIRTAIKRNMDVQNYAFSKKMLDLLISKAPTNKQEELQGLVKVCLQRGLTDRTIDGDEDASQFCAATMGRLPTIGHDSCDTCGAKFSALTSPGCVVCGMGTVQRSDVATGPSSSPFS